MFEVNGSCSAGTTMGQETALGQRPFWPFAALQWKGRLVSR